MATHPPIPVQPIPYASPFTARDAQSGQGMWSDGSTLVTTRQCTCTDTCIKCNAPSVKTLRKKFYWHQPWIYATILLGLLPFAIIAMVLRKEAILQLGLCEKHAKRRFRMILICWGILALGIVMLICGILMLNRAFGREYEEIGGWTMALSFLVMIISGILAATAMPILRPRRMDDHYAWFKGASPELLRQLPSIG